MFDRSIGSCPLAMLEFRRVMSLPHRNGRAPTGGEGIICALRHISGISLGVSLHEKPLPVFAAFGTQGAMGIVLFL